jgi:hypothetical protein
MNIKKGENNMAETKYGKYLTRECVKSDKQREGASVTSTRHLESFGGGDCTIDCIYITSPRLMITQPHQHEFAQYLNFFSANPDDANDFDAEIEISLGEEGEKHAITSPTATYIPPGLHHGPLNFAKVNKPVLFVDIAMSGKYSRIGNTAD